MRVGDLYYNPKTNKLIEITNIIDFTVCNVEMFIVSFNDQIYEEHGYPKGPFLGKLKHTLTDYRKIGEI